jgi:hypothetical protein
MQLDVQVNHAAMYLRAQVTSTPGLASCLLLATLREWARMIPEPRRRATVRVFHHPALPRRQDRPSL